MRTFHNSDSIYTAAITRDAKYCVQCDVSKVMAAAARPQQTGTVTGHRWPICDLEKCFHWIL